MLGAAPAYDRYGGGTFHAPVARAASPYPAPYASRTAPAYTGPRLAWNGKTVVAPQDGGPTPFRSTAARSAYQPAPGAPRARLQYPSMAMAEPVSQIAPRAVQPSVEPVATPDAAPAYAPPVYAPQPRQAAAPTSIYDSAPPTVSSGAPSSVTSVNAAARDTPVMPGPPVRTAQATSGDGPRLYSLHRDYGMEPDPIPLAPQFFGPTADLTTPETPEVGHRTTTSTGAVRNAPTDAGAAQ